MRPLMLIHNQARSDFQSHRSEGDFTAKGAQNGKSRFVSEFPAPRPVGVIPDNACGPYGRKDSLRVSQPKRRVTSRRSRQIFTVRARQF